MTNETQEQNVERKRNLRDLQRKIGKDDGDVFFKWEPSGPYRVHQLGTIRSILDNLGLPRDYENGLGEGSLKAKTEDFYDPSPSAFSWGRLSTEKGGDFKTQNWAIVQKETFEVEYNPQRYKHGEVCYEFLKKLRLSPADIVYFDKTRSKSERGRTCYSGINFGFLETAGNFKEQRKNNISRGIDAPGLDSEVLDALKTPREQISEIEGTLLKWIQLNISLRNAVPDSSTPIPYAGFSGP
jgi:hypothetical protein